MKLSEDQVRKIVQRAVIKRPCINCGHTEASNKPLRVVEIKSSLLTTLENNDEKITPFMIYSCPKCGYTTFINLENLEV